MYPRPVTDQPGFDLQGTLASSGPLSRQQALAALDHAADLMAGGRLADAARLYQRVIGFDDRAVTAAAMLGFGQAMLGLGREDQAVATWREVTQLPSTPATYPAWRQLADALAHRGDLAGAAEAYRQADRLAPPQDRPEVAARLARLREDAGAAGGGARARAVSASAMTLAIIAVTTVVSLAADIGGTDGNGLITALQLDKVAVAGGELYRLVTVVLVHATLFQDPLHLPLNMYAVWIVGPFVERLYGRWRMLAVYLVAAVGASLMSFAMGSASSADQFAVGASGAIFGLFGILVGSIAVQRPALGPNLRGLFANLVALIVINLYIGATTPGIDNWAHVGGLLTGLWLGVLFAPSGVPAPGSLWRRRGPQPGSSVLRLGRSGMLLVQALGLLGLAVAFLTLWSHGYAIWSPYLGQP